MARFKVRRIALLKGGAEIGAEGNTVSELLFGTVAACVPSLTASGGVGTGSMAVANANVGAQVFLQPANGNDGTIVYAACVTAAGEVTASYACATGSAAAAVTASFHYLILS